MTRRSRSSESMFPVTFTIYTFIIMIYLQLNHDTNSQQTVDIFRAKKARKEPLAAVLYRYSFHSVFHSFHELMNSINWPASSVWVFIAQLVENCSANAEATGSNPVKAPKTSIFFFGLLLKYLNCDSTAMVTYSQLLPCGHLGITDTPLIRTAAKSPAKVTDA